jgi:RHS repeat-associated protein
MKNFKKQTITKIITGILTLTFLFTSGIITPAYGAEITQILSKFEKAGQKTVGGTLTGDISTTVGDNILTAGLIDRNTLEQKRVVTQRLIVKYKNQSQAGNIKNIIKERSQAVSVSTAQTWPDKKTEIITLKTAETLSSTIQELKNNQNIEYVQPDYQITTMTEETLIPLSDPDLNLQWGLLNSGQEITGQNGTAGIDLNILPSWQNSLEAQEIIVGIIDTGLDMSHPELSGALLTGLAYDFVNNAGNFDTGDTLHATKLAGIIAANQDNTGMAGIAPNAKILPVKFIENGIGYTSAAIEAIEYAIENGAAIINCSWGSPNYSPALREAIEQHPETLFVCAAGNNGGGVDKIYPAAFNLPNIVSVAAVNNQGDLAPFSNSGGHVLTAAPGVDVYTTESGNSYTYATGSSIAAAFASGAAALYQGINTNKNAAQTAVTLKLGVNPLPSLTSQVLSQGVIDLEAMQGITDAAIQEELDSRPLWDDTEEINEDGSISPLVSDGSVRSEMILGDPYKINPNEQENVSLNSRSLTYYEKDAYIPGKNGLDLDFTLVYNSGRSNPNTYKLNARNDLIYPTRPSILSDLAIGWGYNFTCIRKYQNPEHPNLPDAYLYLPDGRSYFVSEYYDDNLPDPPYPMISGRKGYNWSDFEFHYNDIYPSPCYYYIKYKDGKTDQLDINGRIIKTQDRFGNAITFAYTTNSYGQKVNITDTYGRLITLEAGASATRILTLPDGSTITYYLSADQNPSSSYDDRTLTERHDANGNVKAYVHEWKNMKYSTHHADFNHDYMSVGFALLKQVQHPTGIVTYYDYLDGDNGSNNAETGKLGILGIYQFAPLFNRYESVPGNNPDYNYKSFWKQGSSNFTGYGNSINDGIDYLYDGFTYKTQFIDNNTVHNYTFDNYHQLIQDIKTTIMNEYQNYEKYDYTHYGFDGPTKKKTRTAYQATNTTFNSSSSYYQTVENYECNSYRDITAYWSTLAEGSTSGGEYKTVTTYDSNYHIPLTKTYKKDANTTIVEQNTLTSDYKAVASAKIYENSVLKKQSDYTYNSFGELTQEKGYINTSAFITTGYTHSYNTDDYLLTKTIDNASSAYLYDKMGRIISYTDPNGQETTCEYEPSGRIINITYPDGAEKNYTYDDTDNVITVEDENGNETTLDYTELGLLNSVTSPDGTILKQYQYNTSSLLAQETDGNNNYKTYTYDYFKRIKEEKSYNAAGTLLGQATYDYYQRYNGEPVDRIKKTITGDTNSPDIVTAAESNKHGFKTKNIRFQGSTERADTFTHDYLGNITQEKNALDASAGRSYTYQYKTGYAGQITEKTFKDNTKITTAYDMLGRINTVTDQKNNTATYAYDAFSRLTSEQIPFQGSSYTLKSYAYDDNGNLTEENISNNLPGSTSTQRKTGYEYDERNRLTKVNNYQGNNIENYIEYGYDSAGNRTQMTTGNGEQITEYGYDANNQLISMTDPLEQTETYTYDDNGNLSGKTDRNGVSFAYAYDEKNRLTEVSAGDITKTYVYSKTGNLIQQQEQGQTIGYKYDNLGRIIESNQPGGIKEEYTYNLNGQRLTFSLKQNNVQKINQSYVYNNMDRLQQVKENGNEIASYTYDNNGNQLTKSIGNGTLNASYTYNNANQILTLNNKKGSNTLSSFSYTYYLDGSQASKTDNTGKTTSYTYDGLGRLTTESETNLAKTYSYDNANNRSQMDVTGNDPYSVDYSYDYNNRLIQETIAGTENSSINIYNYDSNGNQISKIKSVYDSPGTDPALGLFQIGTEETNGTYEAQLNQYDVFNRLIQTRGNGINALYQYRPDGLRHSKTVNGETTTHIWDNSNIVLELDGSSQVQNKYLRGNNLIALENNSVRSYYLHNAHGDVVQLTNNSGTVTKDYTFDAFGVEATPDNTDINPFRYAGEYTDKETGSIYLRARYYDPTIGRFMSPDSHWNQANMVYGDNLSGNSAPSITSILQSGNLYVYAMNTPIKYIDPWGLDSVIFYMPGAEEHAKVRAYIYTGEYGTNTYPYEVASARAFVEQWNEIFTHLNETGISVDAIEIISHGSATGKVGNGTGYLYFNENSANQKNRLYARDIAGMAKGDHFVNNLMAVTAKVLNINGCNSANPDIYNVASGFRQQGNYSKITGWDGGSQWNPGDTDNTRGNGDYTNKGFWGLVDPWYYVKRYQHTWWTYVEKNNEIPVREREGRLTFSM